MSKRWNWLRKRLNELDSNPSRFAKELGWPSSRVYELFSGKTKAIPLDKVARAATILGIRLDSMLNFNSGLTDKVNFEDTSPNILPYLSENNVPEIDVYKNNQLCPNYRQNAENNTIMFLHDNNELECQEAQINKRIKDNWRIPIEYLNEINLQPQTVCIIEALGDSMHPTISNGDKVIIDTSDQGKKPSPDGVFAIWDGIGVAIKRIEIIPASTPQMVKIISDNPKHSSYETQANSCHIIGRVASVIKRL